MKRTKIFGLSCIIVGAIMTIYAFGAIFGMSEEFSKSEGWSLALITLPLVLLGAIIFRGILSNNSSKLKKRRKNSSAFLFLI
jgi:hypothetical protein